MKNAVDTSITSVEIKSPLKNISSLSFFSLSPSPIRTVFTPGCFSFNPVLNQDKEEGALINPPNSPIPMGK